MKRGNGPILVFFSDYSFFKDQSWGLQLAARRSWQLHLFRLGHRLPSNSLLFVPGKCDSTQRFQAENSVCLFFKDFYWFLLLSFWMCLEGTIVCKACQHHYLWFRIHLLSLWYRPVPRVGNKDGRDRVLPVPEITTFTEGVRRASCCGSNSGDSWAPWGVRADALREGTAWGEIRGTRQITRDLGSGHTQRERWREIKGQCGVSCSHSSFQSLQQSTFWWARREHLERVRDTMCGALASGEVVHPSGSWQVQTERSTHRAGLRDQWRQWVASTRKQTRPGPLPGEKTVRPGLRGWPPTRTVKMVTRQDML